MARRVRQPAPSSASRPGLRYAGIARARLEEMLDAGREARNCMRVLAKVGSNVVGELLRDVPSFYEWDHYPPGDVFDPATNAQYYYHAHPETERPGEHGHFHTFLRPAGMPRGIKPVPVPGYTPPPDPNAALSHLVAIGMDHFGKPVALFTTNRWVTDETWYRAEDVVRMLDFFEIDLPHPSWPVNRWISAMIPLFRPQIEWLLHRRDAVIAEHQKKNRRVSVYEDRSLDVVSEIAIDVDRQITAIEEALEKAG